MKKLLIVLFGCIICCACSVFSSNYRRNKFEENMPKPVFECGNIGEMPTNIAVSEDEIGDYDYEGCDFSMTGMRPVQQINSREFLAYACGALGCSPSQIYHVRFPYSVGQLGVGSYYKLADDMCLSSQGIQSYSYITQYGLKNTISSINVIKVKLASKTKRKQMLEKLKQKKLEQAQKKWKEQYENQKACESLSKLILEKWENHDDVSHFCYEMEKLRSCRRPYHALEDECFWRGLREYDSKEFESYYQINCIMR